MKKTLIFSSILALSLANTGTLHAQEQVKDARAMLKSEIEARKEKLANQHASTSSEIKAFKVQTTAKAAQMKLDQDLSRLSEIKMKIDSRLSKLEMAGATTTDADMQLSAAVTLIADTQIKIDAVGTSTSTDAVRDTVKEAQMAIISVQKALIDTLPTLKDMEAGIKKR